MLTYEPALARVRQATPAPRTTPVRLHQALDLPLAKPIVARMDLPRFDNAAVDGYALRVSPGPRPDANSHAGPLVLSVVGRAEAGRPFGGPVRAGCAVRILTGAQIPRGANAVVMQEHARRRRDRLVVERVPQAGQHLRRRGEDLTRGTRVLAAGARLRPQEIALLAALGHRTVAVYQRPTVAILTTGN